MEKNNMNEQGTQVAPLLFNQLNPGGGEVITHYDFFMEVTWNEEHRPAGNMDVLHFLFEAEGGLRARFGTLIGPAYIIQVFNTRNGSLMGAAEEPRVTDARQNKYYFAHDFLWDKPDIKGLRARFILEGLSNMWDELQYHSYFLIWARFTTILHAPIIHKIIDIGVSSGQEGTAFSNKGTIIRPDVLTFLTYDEFMKKFKAARSNQ